ncbi:MAG: DNA cytosine methyltransferase [Prevotella sp.]|jgi:DNA (cytosine-5)-methyltransferase 1|nr:DNA cytosine methyltransferase [Prevotella sp.]
MNVTAKIQEVYTDGIMFLYVDLFCGAGGTSTGVEKARLENMKIAKVIACVNHDKNAIASHAANLPEAKHYTEDVRALDLTELVAHIALMRQIYRNVKIVLWISAECTSHSNAKGGTSRDADSRSLPEEMYRYIKAINPDIIQVENVKEFLDWGPLIIKVVRDKKTKEELYCPLDIKREKKKRGQKQVVCIRPTWIPDQKFKKTYYNRWINEIKSYGYHYDYRVLNAANYGAYTSRERYFGIFAKEKKYIVFPKPTHSKDGKNLPKWKAVKEVLDFTEMGESLFGRKKDLSENTLKRIYAGLIKFVAGGKDNFLIKWNSMQQNGNYIAPSTDDPCPTVTCQNRLGIANVRFIQQRNSGNPDSKVISIEQPARTVTATGGNQELVQCRFLSKYYSGHPESKNISVEGPAHAIKCKDNHSLISCSFLAAYYGNGANVTSIEQPSPVIRTKDTCQLVWPRFIVNNYSGGGQTSDLNNPSPAIKTNPNQNIVYCRMIDQQYGQSKPASIENPIGAITQNPKFNLVEAKWIMNSNFNNVGHSVESPAPTICAGRRHHYLMNPQYQSAGSDINNPCFTLIARMDKKPPHLVSTVEGSAVILIYESDSPMTKKIKEFMAMYGIADILMRMLLIRELKSIMGFPKGYKLIGTQTEQKKYIGNAVEVNMAMAMCTAIGEVEYHLLMGKAINENCLH